MKPEIKPIVTKKQLKHVLTLQERAELGTAIGELLNSYRGVESEAQQAKDGFKARLSELDAAITSKSTLVGHGWELREKQCVVVFRPADRQKDFYTTDDNGKVPWETGGEPTGPPALTEPMTPDDFVQELFQAESAFDHKAEIELFPPTDRDSGRIVVGTLAGKWYSAARVTIGDKKLEERLDTEQKTYKERFPAITTAAKRVSVWLKENFKDLAKGFEEPIFKAVDAEKENAE